MSSILLGDQPFVQLVFLDAGIMLFGLLMCLYGGSLTVTLLLKRQPGLYRVLVVLLTIQLFLLLGIIALDLGGVTTTSTYGAFESLSSALSTHRWLIIQLPVFLMCSSIISLLVFGEKLADRHSTHYRWMTMSSIWIAFFVIVLIGLESMI